MEPAVKCFDFGPSQNGHQERWTSKGEGPVLTSGSEKDWSEEGEDFERVHSNLSFVF